MSVNDGADFTVMRSHIGKIRFCAITPESCAKMRSHLRNNGHYSR
ncbi:hypothetical protein ACQFX9_29060 [Aliinostoc sp. HNIBRCY26]